MKPKFAFLWLFLILLTACQAGGRQATATPARTPIPTAAPPSTSTPQATALQPTAVHWNTTISIWYSWDQGQAAAMEQIMRTFQQAYPDVRFDVRYVPAENILADYRRTAYNGSGPTILLGDALWGPNLMDDQLIMDLTDFVGPELEAALLTPARALGQYRGQWLGLPFATSGVVLYRNPAIVPQSSADFEQLIVNAQAVTRGGVVGADLERGSLYSSGHISGLGGGLMNAACDPTINNDYGLAWINLLQDFERAGPTELNTNRDLQLFLDQRAGMIIEGTWRMNEIGEQLGTDNLRIDPWPDYGEGHLSGLIWANHLYLNFDAVGDEQQAALAFMNYMLAPEVQTLLAEVGFIPANKNAQPRNPLLEQALLAFERGTPFPLCPENSAYWGPIDTLLYQIFVQDADPSETLQQAALSIEKKLIELRTSP